MRTLAQVALLALVVLAQACTTVDSGPGRRCHTYVVVPPQHDDEKASDEAAAIWAAQATARLRKCDKLIAFDKGKAVFLLLGITHEARPTPSELGGDQVERLIDKTGATHLVMLTAKVAGSKVKIFASVFRLAPWQRERGLALAQPVEGALPKGTALKESSSVRWAARSLRLIPNAMMVGLATSQLENQRVTNNELKEAESHERSALPPVLSSVALTSLDHPDGMSLFDVNTTWFGGVAFVDSDTSYRYVRPADPNKTPPTPETSFDYSLAFFMIVPMVIGEVSFHSPLGTTFFDAGVGPGLYTYHDSLEDKGSGVVLMTRLDFGHTVFLSEKWFVQVDFSFLYPTSPIVANDAFILAQHTYAVFGLGYYFPELRSWARGMF